MDRHDIELLADRSRRFAYRFLFGDQVGLAIFLGALMFFGLTWRTGFFINDNFSLANGLVNLVDGHFHFTHVAYGPANGDSPGTYTDGTRVYARNYGMIVAAVPFYIFLQFLAFVADFQVAIIALWSLLVLAFCVVLGRVCARPQLGNYAGSLLALVLFTVNVAFATPLASGKIGLLALQFVSMLAAALVGVLVYRLLVQLESSLIGVVGGVFAVLATPIGFWATIPKRHVIIAMLVLAAAYSLYRARAEGSLRFRALAYVWPALAAWVHPPDGIVLFVALASIDLVTRRKLAIGELAVMAIVFLIALTPFIATNLAITGGPLEPPRFLPDYKGELLLDQGIPENAEPKGGSGADNVGGASGDGSGASGIEERVTGENPNGDSVGSGTRAEGFAGLLLGLVSSLLGAASDVSARLSRFEYAVSRGWSVVTDTDRMYETFVRSGISGPVAEDEFRAIRLSFLESIPLAGLLVALPFGLGRSRLRAWLASPQAVVDLFAVAYGVFLALVYLPRLPLHATITVRYLVPMMPLLLYLGLRSTRVKTVIEDALEPLVASYVVAVMFGLVAVGALTVDAVLIERMRLHAFIATAVWPLLGVVFILPNRMRGIVVARAVMIGVVAGATTVFILMSSVAHYAVIGDHALPFIEVISQALRT